jgi:hypothetical protein
MERLKVAARLLEYLKNKYNKIRFYGPRKWEADPCIHFVFKDNEKSFHCIITVKDEKTIIPNTISMTTYGPIEEEFIIQTHPLYKPIFNDAAEAIKDLEVTRNKALIYYFNDN